MKITSPIISSGAATCLMIVPIKSNIFAMIAHNPITNREARIIHILYLFVFYFIITNVIRKLTNFDTIIM